jgi:hypothetical protein
MIYVTYDSGASYPQDAKFGLGVSDADGNHVPPSGLSSFSVEDSDLVHGTREDFYTVTAADVLTPLSGVEVDNILLGEYKLYGYTVADNEAERRIVLAELNPAIGQYLDENGRIRNNRRRNTKAKRRINEITDADDHLLDHTDLIFDSRDLRIDAIESTSTTAEIDAIIADIKNDIHWPTWSPID